MVGAGPGGRQLLDTRNDAKLDNFPGKREYFENWAVMFESYAHLMGWGMLVDAAIVEQQPIANEGLSADARARSPTTCTSCWRARCVVQRRRW